MSKPLDPGSSVLIIGGGIAGLIAGIYGSMAGFKPTILEMHTRTGGAINVLGAKWLPLRFLLAVAGRYASRNV